MADVTQTPVHRLIAWHVKRIWKAAHESAINEPTIVRDDPVRGIAACLQQIPKLIEPAYQAVATDPESRAMLCKTDENFAMYFKIKSSWTKKKVILGQPVPVDPLDPKIVFGIDLHPDHRVGSIDGSEAVPLSRKILMDLVDYAKRFESWSKEDPAKAQSTLRQMLQDPLFSSEERRSMEAWAENRLRTLETEHEAARPDGFDEETFLMGL